MCIGAAADGVALQNQHMRTQRDIRKFHGFRMLPKNDPEYLDLRAKYFEAHGRPSLDDVRHALESPSIQPESLYRHRWYLSEISPEESKEEGNKGFTGADDMEIDGDSTSGMKSDIESGTKDPRIGTETYGKGPRCDNANASIPYRGVKGKKRPHASIADGDSAQQPANHRKSVCTHCWEWRKTCDSDAPCTACQANQVRCVRKLCEQGSMCGSQRCPCLHPGEWHQQDPEWIVEGGYLPKQRDISECAALSEGREPTQQGGRIQS